MSTPSLVRWRIQGSTMRSLVGPSIIMIAGSFASLRADGQLLFRRNSPLRTMGAMAAASALVRAAT
ncbi:Uncharacterised protein [Mycobacterium tuberculosis]|nr:Uncharacterised protein [Mycobacterium tuberculosis]COW35244.1 Uncharacterised protein [Mycobacterium tuberculosis]COW93645.1 Uncharacterised protein [Mycobacterium tuberculosis]